MINGRPGATCGDRVRPGGDRGRVLASTTSHNMAIHFLSLPLHILRVRLWAFPVRHTTGQSALLLRSLSHYGQSRLGFSLLS